MENKDTIFDQFKNAADNESTKDFASMDSVWNRIEDKLDNKVLKKETKTWRKIAIAASILLFSSIGYQYFKTENNIAIPENSVVTNSKSEKIIQDKAIESDSKIALEYPNINPNAEQIITKTTSAKEIIAYNEPDAVSVASPVQIPASAPQASEVYDKVIAEVDDDAAAYKKLSNSKTHLFKSKIYDARGVKESLEEVAKPNASAVAKQETKKQNPLYVVDGEAANSGRGREAKDNLTADNIENIVVLKEPLYIINGTEYSEESLFGNNPTSPYAPLDQQEIIKTLVFQGQEALKLYGEKGRKGVVVVTTKNGKAVKK